MGIFASLKKIVRNKSELKNLFLIKKSKYFNKKWYLNTYPNVKKAKMDAAVHYLKYGWKEGRDPSPLFSTKQYLMQNKDVAAKGINPLIHFEKYGKKENRKIFYNGVIDCKSEFISKNSTYNQVKEFNIFDIEYYNRYYGSTQDNIYDFLKYYPERKPNQFFYPKEYLLIYPDIAHRNVNALWHYEKYGKYEGRAVSLADIKEYQIPENTISIEKEIEKRKSYDKNIVTVLAMFSSSAKIEEYQLYLLKGIKKISDYIIIVADNTIYEEELKKLDGLCNAYRFIRHGEYDFGSYKRGYNYLMDNNILENDDNLLFINDSNYGPVYPFENIINDFKSKTCDFYGLSCGRDNEIVYIQSFFYIFKPVVYKSHIFCNFINKITKRLSVYAVVLDYEYKLTNILKEKFCFDTYIDNTSFFPEQKILVPTQYCYKLITGYNYPFIKKRMIQHVDQEEFNNILEEVKKRNNECFSFLKSIEHKPCKSFEEIYTPSKYNIYSNYAKKLEKVHEKYMKGEKINITFLVNKTSMFPAEKLMLLMKDDNIYNVKLYVIPDVSFGNKEMYRIYNDTFNELTSKYNYVEHSVEFDSEKEEIIDYKNIIKAADIVCYPSPYDVSFSLYNPYYSVQENKLSIYINNEFTTLKTDLKKYRIDNYNNFWKVFLETNINNNEYRIYGQCEAKNSVVVGYSKMVKLQKYMDNRKKDNRKKIIIAPHYSVDGSVNKALSLSHFEKYADLFLELPLKYPEIDFIFRPHPVLFTALKRANHWGEEKVKKYIDKFISYENVTYSIEGDYLEVFANSDGIIQDSESFLVEYLYTGKPCCYMLKSEKDIHDKFNELGIKCLEHTYIAYDEDEIIDFIENIIIQEKDYKKYIRTEFIQHELVLDNLDTFKQINKIIRENIMF